MACLTRRELDLEKGCTCPRWQDECPLHGHYRGPTYPKKPSQALTHVKRFLTFFSLQFLNYSLLVWNIRVAALGWMWQVLVSDLLIAALSFTLIKKVSAAHDKVSMAGYVVGGMAGSGVAVLVTKYLWGT